MSKADNSYVREIGRIEKYDLLILDDFGLASLDSEARLILLEIIEDRHNRKSTIISSQLPVASWYEVIGESTIADAILDRMVHTAHRIELKGDHITLHRLASTNQVPVSIGIIYAADCRPEFIFFQIR
ncbi:MAG TPA: ATP-binding protein [Hanamia sp.]